MSEDLPNLKELWIRWPAVLWQNCGPAFRSSTSDVEEIQSPSISMMKCIPWRIPVEQLTVLRLFEFPIDRCGVYLLLSCRNLVKFHCNDPSYPPSVYDATRLLPVPERPKSLHSIKQIWWRARRQCQWLWSNEDWMVFLFSSIRFSNLERLFWDCNQLFDEAGLPSSLPVEYIFYQNFIPSLRQLRALDLESYCPLHTHVCPMVQYTDFDSVEQLYFAPLAKESELVSWFKMLTPKKSKTCVLFPNLKTIRMKVPTLDIAEAELFDAYRRFSEKRREQNKCQVPLEQIAIESYIEPQFDQNQKDILSRFVANGLVVKWEQTEDDWKI